MTWSFAFNGKAAKVRAEVEKQARTLHIMEEQSAFEAAKQSVLCTLSGCDPELHVFVQASGSASSENQYSKKLCRVKSTVPRLT